MRRRLRVNAPLITAARTAATLVGASAACAATDPLPLRNDSYVGLDGGAAVWAAAQPGDGRQAAIASSIAREPAAGWSTGASGPGLAAAHGFSPNVSASCPTDRNVAYGDASKAHLSAPHGCTKPFLIDTSRNRNDGNGEWRNPPGAKLGSTDQVGGGTEMLLGSKAPVEPDGDCGAGTGTVAGRSDPQLAHSLVHGY